MQCQTKLELRSIRSLSRREDMLSAIRLHCDMLPNYLPQRFGWTEPRQPFDKDDLERLIPSDRGGRADNIWWKRSGKHRANGGWMLRARGNAHWPHDGHSTIYMSVFDTGHQNELVKYLKVASISNECDFAFLDGLTEGYRPYASRNGMNPWSDSFSAPTHLLCHWLPDILWSTVLGPAYVRMFGKDRVLNAPAHVVEEIGQETVFLQLTPKLEDIEQNFDAVMAARERVKQHLGLDAFFQPEKAYDWREHPERAGSVFRVPEFRLPSD